MPDINEHTRQASGLSRPAPGTEMYDKMHMFTTRFEKEGFVKIPGEEMARLVSHADPLPLTEAANSLPLDSTGDGLRRRLYRTAMFFPWTGVTKFDPVFRGKFGEYVPYYQDKTLNSDQGGQERRFSPIPDHFESDDLLTRLIAIHFFMIPHGSIESRLPVRVGLHLIRLWSDGRRACVPSPNTLHCDGEPFTSIILIDRFNVTPSSARNVIAQRSCAGLRVADLTEGDSLLESTLLNPLDTIYCDDSRVCHGVSGVLGAAEQEGWRTSLLIDFSDIKLSRTQPPKTRFRK